MNWKKSIGLLGISLIMLTAGCTKNPTPDPQNKNAPPVNPYPTQDKDTSGQPKSSSGTYVSEINLLEKGLQVDYLDYGINGSMILSPNGKYAVFSGGKYVGENQGEPESQLILADLTDGKVKVLDTGRLIKVLEWSPDGNKILYRKFESLFMVSLNAVKPTEISARSYHGTFSPDGTKIAFSEYDAGISVVETDSEERKTITTKKGDWYPVWYPDGKTIFYFADRGITLSDGAGQLQGFGKVNIDTGKQENLITSEQGKYRQASWVVPGKTLLIDKGWDDGRFEILVNLEKGKITELGENSQQQFSTAIDRDNGLVYKAELDKITTIDADGMEITSVPFKKPVDGRFFRNFGYTVSPNGKMLAYLFGEEGFHIDSNIKGRKIWVVRNDGMGMLELTKKYGDYQQPSWTPDGSHVVAVETDGGRGGKFMLRILKAPVI